METLRYVVLVNGLLAVVGLAYYVLLRRETFFGANRLALWLGLAGAFVLPLLELPDWRPQPIRTAMQRTAQVIVPKVLPNTAPQPDVTITFPNGQTVPAFRKTQTPVAWSWQFGLIGVYLLGVLLLLIRFGYQLLSLRKLIRQSANEPYDDFILVRNEAVTSPFSFFRWVVLNPDQHTPDELEQILRHERVHVRDRHSVDMLGAELVCIVFWFNPAAYLFRHLLHQTLEFSADRAVLAEGIDAKLYQYNLLRVSLSEGQSVITNHFSRSQLKSRIDMINRSRSTRATWLKYPALLLATLSVATLFARPNAHTMAKFLPRPAAQMLATVVDTEAEKPQFAASAFTGRQQSVQLATQPLVSNRALPADTVQKSTTSPDTVQASPSRYMQYDGDKLFWIITPKTSFDDLAIMKREFARHGYKMQVQTLKYDPLNTYISDIKVKVIRPIVGVSDFEETGVDGGPIRSHGGYNGINSLNTVAAVGSYPFNADFLHIPQELIQIARNEESSFAKLTDDKKMEGLIAEGNRKYGPLGIGFRRFSKEEIKKQSTPNSAISVKPDGSIVINEAPGIIKAFINNEPTTLDNIQRLKINQLYTVAVILGYDAATNKRNGTNYLFFYVNKDN